VKKKIGVLNVSAGSTCPCTVLAGIKDVSLKRHQYVYIYIYIYVYIYT